MVDLVKVKITELNGVELEFDTEYLLIAENIPFDNSTNGFIADNVQDAIEEIGASASPGFSFGRSGNVFQNTWLNRVGNIPSNRTGVTIGINSPIVSQVFCANRNIETYTIGIYEHDGNSVNLTLLGTVDVVSSRSATFNVSFATSTGKQLAVRLLTASGSIQDLGVDVILIGSN